MEQERFAGSASVKLIMPANQGTNKQGMPALHRISVGLTPPISIWTWLHDFHRVNSRRDVIEIWGGCPTPLLRQHGRYIAVKLEHS